MKDGVCMICVARLCPRCKVEMETACYVRFVGDVRMGRCDRCGKTTTTMKYRYLMTGAEMMRRGLKLI